MDDGRLERVDDMITMVKTHFASLSPVQQNELRVTKLVSDSSNGGKNVPAISIRAVRLSISRRW